MNWTLKPGLLQDKDGNVVDPDKFGWPNLVYDSAIDKYVYKDNMCTAYAAVSTYGNKWKLALEIIPKEYGLSKEHHTLANIDGGVYINVVVGEFITKWQKDKGNAGLIRHYTMVDNGKETSSTNLGIVNRLRMYGLTEAEIQQRCAITKTKAKINKPKKKKEPTKRHWTKCLSDAVKGIKCTS